MRRSFIAVLVVLMLAAVVAGCQPVSLPEAEQEAAEAESALCQSIAAYRESVAALEAVTADTTVDEVKQLQATADAAYEEMISAAAEVSATEVQVVESAVAEFRTTLNDVPGEATLGEVHAGIQASAATVREAVDALGVVGQCAAPE